MHGVITNAMNGSLDWRKNKDLSTIAALDKWVYHTD